MSKQKTKPEPEAKDEYLVLPIQRWNWVFSYGLDAISGYKPGTRRDFRHLHVFGQFQRPQRLAGPRVELAFAPYDPAEQKQSPPLFVPDNIGSLWGDPRRNRYLGLVLMPNDALPSLLTVLAANRVRYVVMVGIQRSAQNIDVREYSFVMDEEDLPAEDATPDGDMEELRERSMAKARA